VVGTDPEVVDAPVSSILPLEAFVVHAFVPERISGYSRVTIMPERETLMDTGSASTY
jgi:hypothetical protein